MSSNYSLTYNQLIFAIAKAKREHKMAIKPSEKESAVKLIESLSHIAYTFRFGIENEDPIMMQRIVKDADKVLAIIETNEPIAA